MIEFIGQDGAPIAVNPSAVWHVRPASGEQTAIYSAAGTSLFVRADYGEVVRRFREFHLASGVRFGT